MDNFKGLLVQNPGALDTCLRLLEISVLLNIVLIIPRVVDLAGWAIEKWRARYDPL